MIPFLLNDPDSLLDIGYQAGMMNMNIACAEKDGFTLIELMVAVAVIAILAAIAIPSYIGVQKKAARSEAKSKLEAISLALEGHMAENNNYGDAGVYNYVCGPGCPGASFAHSGAIGTVANLGNNLQYSYQIIVTANPTPLFSLRAIPSPGSRVDGDFAIWLFSNGQRGPTEAGW